MIGQMIAVFALAAATAPSKTDKLDNIAMQASRSAEAAADAAANNAAVQDAIEAAEGAAREAVEGLEHLAKVREARLTFCRSVPDMGGDWIDELDRQIAIGMPLGEKTKVIELCVFFMEGYAEHLQRDLDENADEIRQQLNDIQPR